MVVEAEEDVAATLAELVVFAETEVALALEVLAVADPVAIVPVPVESCCFFIAG